MRLKSLSVVGFKSFADRMDFDFGEGITAVIGPNGCGKSNVVDAIKWVVGEQSAKALRGGEMIDVIFNGCASRRAMAMAEVTLTLDEVRGQIELDGAEEVAITRRLFRDGSSGYYLNGRACRLRDLRELFMGTGIGTSAYAVIEQGRVGFILESNTKDRRLILEEAAGISKYKSRRKIAARKLERVDLDLQRISEVLAEVRRRAKQVQKQAAAALRWKELSDQVKALRMVSALEEHGRLTGERAGLVLACETLTDRAAAAATRSGEHEAAAIAIATELVAIDQSLRDEDERRAAAVTRRDIAQARGRDARSRLIELDDQEEEDRGALATWETKIAALTGQHRQAEAAVAMATQAADLDGDERMRSARAALDGHLATCDGLIRRVEELKSQQVSLLRERSRIETEQGRLAGSLAAVAERQRRLEGQSGGQTEALARLRAAEAQAQAVVAERLQAAVAAHQRYDELIAQRERLLGEGNRLDQALAELRHQRTRADTTLRLLSEQEARNEGVNRGVKDVLTQMDRLPGIVGLVADLIRIDDAHVTAIETALGQQAQNVVTTTQSAAKEAVEFLKREKRGRATFLPLDDVDGGERVPRELLREPGVVDIASRLVGYADEHRNVIEFCLGNVLIVETLDHALAIRRRHRTTTRIVTLDGEVVAAGGAITGGRMAGHEGGGVVSRKHEIAKLVDQARSLEAEERLAAQTRDRVRAEAAQASQAVESQRQAIRASDLSASEARTALMACERDRQHADEASSGVGSELAEIAAAQAKIASESRDLSAHTATIAEQELVLAGAVDAAQGELALVGAARDRAQETVNNLRVDLATGQERLESARTNLAHLVRAIQELEDGRDAANRRLATIDQRRTELHAAIDASAAEHAAAATDAAQLAAAMTERVNKRDQLRDRGEDHRIQAREAAAEQRAAEQERQQLELKQNEAKVRLEALTQRVLDDYQVDLAEAFSNWQRPADLDTAAVKSELAKAEKELHGLGPVNLAAIDELEEATSRADFLQRQFDDLDQAKTKLMEIIGHIDDVSRKLFEATYDRVRENFRGLFRKLFGGGSADLRLERFEDVTVQDEAPPGEPQPPPRIERREVDVLEAGLEIVAQPPGKNPKIITQLSGGEKALTAISLLFAVYQAKPSPFCILDEVDAPLDDANVDVYNSMIREFTRSSGNPAGSQFIVITHKKRTMQRSDCIYGITQNEPGVSTKISVRMEDVERIGETLSTTVRGAGPYAG
ncbi:chromosome partition protein Smc [Planctomycetota bacterium]|nr:chromosome partition protein Smc [Planctomycetota bacterium]